MEMVKKLETFTKMLVIYMKKHIIKKSKILLVYIIGNRQTIFFNLKY